MARFHSLKKFFFYIYSFLKETEHKWGRGRERGRQNPRQAPGSELSAQSPTRGLNSIQVPSHSPALLTSAFSLPPAGIWVLQALVYLFTACPLHLKYKFHDIKMAKVKQRIVKTARGRQLITYKGNSIKLSADFSAETSQARREWHGIFKILQG